MLTFLVSVVIFGLLIGFHEAGHLTAAKLCGVRVLEFAIGMGPSLFSFKRGETVYKLKLLPVGGYCRLEGEDESSNSETAFCNAHPLKKIIILVSGAFMNMVLGIVALFIIISGSKAISTNVVDKVMPDAPAFTQGLKDGDRVVRVNNSAININSDIQFAMRNNSGENISVNVLRDGKKVKLNISPYYYEGRYIIGYNTKTETNNFFLSAKNAFYSELFIAKAVLVSFAELIKGTASIKEASGPVGIVKEIGSAAKKGIYDVLYIFAIITINLGLFNLLPLPALDGGRVVFSIYELVFRKRVPEKIEGAVHSIGFLLLMLLMIFVTVNDVFSVRR